MGNNVTLEPPPLPMPHGAVTPPAPVHDALKTDASSKVEEVIKPNIPPAPQHETHSAPEKPLSSIGPVHLPSEHKPVDGGMPHYAHDTHTSVAGPPSSPSKPQPVEHKPDAPVPWPNLIIPKSQPKSEPPKPVASAPEPKPKPESDHGLPKLAEHIQDETTHLEKALEQVKEDLKVISTYLSRVEVYLPQVETYLAESKKQPHTESQAPSGELVLPHPSVQVKEEKKLEVPPPKPQEKPIVPPAAAVKVETHGAPPVVPIAVHTPVKVDKPPKPEAVSAPPKPETSAPLPKPVEVKPSTPPVPDQKQVEADKRRQVLEIEIDQLRQKLDQSKKYFQELQDQAMKRQEMVQKIEKESKKSMMQVEKMLERNSEEMRLEEEYKLLMLELAPYRDKLKTLQEKEVQFGNLSIFQFGEWKRLKGEIEALQHELSPFAAQVARAREIYDRIKDLPRWREMLAEVQKLGDQTYLNQAKPDLVNDITSQEDVLKQKEDELAKLGK